ncbi:MAG: PilZ domain-containing protein [Vicinamibacteria bacterium]
MRRLVPRQSATVAVYRADQQVGYGIVTNVSESGACIVTDATLAPGADLRLKLSFYQQPRLFETVARVVWSREATAADEGFAGLRLHGLRFTVTSTVERTRLVQILQKEDSFVTVFKPTVTEFDRLQRSLSNELDALGDKIDKSLGRNSV